MPTPRPAALIDRLLAEYDRTGRLPRFSGGDHEDENPPAPNPDEKPTDQKPDRREIAEKLKADADLQQFVNDMIAAERKRTEDKLKAEADEREREAREAREREEAEKRGDFEQVKQDYETRVSSLATEKQSIEARLKQYEELVKADVDAQWGEIPEEVRETYTGDPEDVLARKDHIVRNKKIIERLTAGTTTTRGNGPNPPAGKPVTEEAKSPVSGRAVLN